MPKKNKKEKSKDKADSEELNPEKNNVEGIPVPELDPPDNGVKYDIKEANKYLLAVFKDSEEYTGVTDEKSEAIEYDKWRKKIENERKKPGMEVNV